jgi:hypothetical protein
MFTPTSTSTDPTSGDTFVSTMESDLYPIMGTQFHPEKILEQWTDSEGLEHNWSAYELNKYFGEEFIKLARQSSNNPGTYEEVQTRIIQNYSMIPTTTYYGTVYAF